MQIIRILCDVCGRETTFEMTYICEPQTQEYIITLSYIKNGKEVLIRELCRSCVIKLTHNEKGN